MGLFPLLSLAPRSRLARRPRPAASIRPAAFFCLAASLFLPAAAIAATHVVRPDGGGDFATIQAAIDAAVDGDTIELTDGWFTGAGNRDIQLDKRLTIRAQNGPGGSCIIDCQGSISDRHRGFSIDDQGAGSLLEGITIQHAYVLDPGGALDLYETSLTIDQCIFYDNYADMGGGAIYAPTGCDLQITGCTFILNRADQSGMGGGAIYLEDGTTANATGCLFHRNRSASLGGGDVYCSFSDLTLTSCTLHETYGRAIYLDSGSTAALAHTMIVFGDHAAVRCVVGSSATLSCCDVFGNAGGDWTGCLAGQEGQNGNISLDPLLCRDPSHPYYLCANSPCAPFSFPNHDCDLIGAFPVACGPHVYTLRPDGSGDFPTIQAALDGAWYGSIVELENGTYTGNGNRDILFPNRPVTLRSASGNPALCVIDCQGSPETQHRAFVFEQMNMDWCVIENIEMRNGYAGSDIGSGGAVRISSSCTPVFRGCSFRNNLAPNESGGAVVISGSGSAPTIEGCSFDSNQARDGGAIASLSGSPRITDCRFTANRCGERGAAIKFTFGESDVSGCSFLQNDASWHGGAVLVEMGSVSFTDCVFSGNSCRFEGGALSLDGFTLCTVTGCVFYGNSASNEFGSGGAIFTEADATTADRCRFIGNSADRGGAIDAWCENLAVSWCTFSDNTATGEGGAIFRWDSSGNLTTLSHSTFYHNASAEGGSGLHRLGDGLVTLSSNIFAFGYSGAAIGGQGGGSVQIDCTDIYGNEGGDWVGHIADQLGQNGNICEDPLFCLDDNPAEPYTLHDSSPCAGQHNPDCGLIGAWPVGCSDPIPADVMLIGIHETAVRQALVTLGIPFHEFYGEDWTGLDLSPYAHVYVAIHGGSIEQASLQHVADYAAQGGHLHFYGGSDYPAYAQGLNAYLLENDTNNHQWTELAAAPHVRMEELTSYLARSHNWIFDFQDWSATCYQTRLTDPDMIIAARNSSGVPMLVSKEIGAGTLDLCINSPMTESYSDPTDYAWLQLTVRNMHDLTPGAVVFTAVEDVYTTSFMPEANFGGLPDLGAGSTDEWGPGFFRTYAKFDLEAIAGRQIASALLWLDQHETGPGQEGSPCSVHRVVEPWEEFEITWMNQAAHVSQVVDVETVGREGDIGILEWDVTSLVQAWASGMPDYGLVVRHQTETINGGIGRGLFRAAESPVPMSPRILITVREPSSVDDGPHAAADLGSERLRLSPPSPNPTTGHVTVALEGTGSRPVAAEILDVQGRIIRRLTIVPTRGSGLVLWDGCGENGAQVASGRYYMRLRSGGETGSRAIVLLK